MESVESEPITDNRTYEGAACSGGLRILSTTAPPKSKIKTARFMLDVRWLISEMGQVVQGVLSPK